MRITLTVDSVHADDLRSVLLAHRSAVQSSAPPQSIEATDSLANNGGALVCVMGNGFHVQSIPLTAVQAVVFASAVAS